MLRVAAAIAAGIVVSALVLAARGHDTRAIDTRLVAEDASAPLRRLAIHYAPISDAEALPVYEQLLRALPASVEVVVEVATAADYDRFVRLLGAGQLARLRSVVVGHPITTWSRDRYAALVDRDGGGSILAPPRLETPITERAGDMHSPDAISQALYGRAPRYADFAFEGGDLAATPRYVFADANLVSRNAGRGPGRIAIERELGHRLGQEVVWLGDALGDVPRHHIMMYLVPLDDHTVAVGDVRAGAALLTTPLALDDLELQAARFDRAAALVAARGFRVIRVPALVLAGAGSFVTYTNALFDRRGDTRIVYLPTYALPALDAAGIAFWRAQGFEVYPIDVSTIYERNGSLGCLVNVLARH
ncbi:MAG: hypothetical protein ABI867_31180 [Kofleriaceae bacterium]